MLDRQIKHFLVIWIISLIFFAALLSSESFTSGAYPNILELTFECLAAATSISAVVSFLYANNSNPLLGKIASAIALYCFVVAIVIFFRSGGSVWPEELGVLPFFLSLSLAVWLRKKMDIRETLVDHSENDVAST